MAWQAMGRLVRGLLQRSRFMRKQVSLWLSGAVLAGCAATPQPGPWQHWQCDSGVELHWRLVDEQAELRLDGAQRLYRLAQQPAASGALYSDGELALHTKGEQGLLYWVADDDLIGRDCKAQ